MRPPIVTQTTSKHGYGELGNYSVFFVSFFPVQQNAKVAQYYPVGVAVLPSRLIGNQIIARFVYGKNYTICMIFDPFHSEDTIHSISSRAKSICIYRGELRLIKYLNNNVD
jgi:hypothetical protein